MFTILKVIIKGLGGQFNELSPALKIMLYAEIGFYSLLGFVIFIWQPEFL